MNLDHEPSECAFYKTGAKVCSSSKSIDNMKKLLPNGGKNINDPKEVVKLVKEKLNCPSESCILTNPQFKKIVGDVQVIRDELEMNFKPPGPANNIKELFNNIYRREFLWRRRSRERT